ncbi:MAG: hypothetical protein JKX84_00515 [Flavobacteriales bacterium]|nr:hypothetical protein [Flavobacteriales bacterium]
MERSIETIWKEGFLKSDALIAPKLNNLYNQKSIDIVDKFRRMYKWNIIALIAFTVAILPISYLSEMPYMGILMSVVFLSTAYSGSRFKKKLDRINKNTDSYQYLRSFDAWTKEMMQFNAKISRFTFSYVFLSMLAGFWFGSIGGDIPGQKLVNELLSTYPDMIMVFGVPLYGLIAVVLITIVISIFGQRLGKLDLDIVYGRIFKRLEKLLAEMEELRA